MSVVHKSVIVPYTQKQMYDLVNNIDQYSQFVPACESSQILHQTEDEIRASLSFSKNGIKKSFTTLNRLQPHKMIEIRLVNGPFKRLEGFWRFEALPDNSCKVILDLEFEFSTTILRIMFGPVFHQASIMLIDAFQSRAREVYG